MNTWNDGRYCAMVNALRQLRDVMDATTLPEMRQELEWLEEEWIAFIDHMIAEGAGVR